MGHSALTSQALSAPPYLVAFLTVVLTARLSDHYRTRSLFIICHATLAATGYAVIAIAGALQASPAWRYAGIFPTTMGFFSAITIIITWTINNQDSASKKGTGVAMLNFIGQLGPLVGVQLYPASDGPFYVRGMAVCATFMAAAAALAWGLRRLLAAKNRRVKHNYEPVGMEDEGLNEGLDGKKEMPFQFML